MLLFALAYLGIGARLRDFSERLADRRFLQAVIFVTMLLVLIGVLTLPIDLYGHHPAVKYNQSVQDLGSWLIDWIGTRYCGAESQSVRVS